MMPCGAVTLVVLKCSTNSFMRLPFIAGVYGYCSPDSGGLVTASTTVYGRSDVRYL